MCRLSKEFEKYCVLHMLNTYVVYEYQYAPLKLIHLRLSACIFDRAEGVKIAQSTQKLNHHGTVLSSLNLV